MPPSRPRWSATALVLLPLAATLLACTGWPAGASTGPANLKPASELQAECFGWPEQAFTPRNKSGKPATRLDKGAPAVDFELADLAGKPHRLADLLAEGPVLLMTGSYTCPRYQENEAAVAATAKKYAGKIKTVLVYTLEAHPKSDPTPYHGDRRPKEYSDRDQPSTYAERVAHARDLKLGDDVLVLVDALGAGKSNPVWCTYGTCPSCSWLITKDGTIEAVHLWHDPASMDGSIDALLERG